MSFLGNIKKWTYDVPLTVLNAATALGVVAGTVFLHCYRRDIQRRKEKIQSKLSRGLVYRDNTNTNTNTNKNSSKAVKVLELHPDFLEKHSSSWQLCSLGEYLSTLRFITDDNSDNDDENNSNDNSTTTQNSKIAEVMERELYVLMAALLMKTLGEKMGAALLPMMGTKKAESILGTVSSRVVHYIMAQILVDSKNSESWDPTQDQAAFPFNVSEIIR